MFKVGDVVWTRYAGQVWFGPVARVFGAGEATILTIERLPLTGQVSALRCFGSEDALLDAYQRSEAILGAARHKAAALRDEARELEAQAEHLRRTAFDVERDATAQADLAFTSAPR